MVVGYGRLVGLLFLKEKEGNVGDQRFVDTSVGKMDRILSFVFRITSGTVTALKRAKSISVIFVFDIQKDRFYLPSL